jgi:phosphopantothenoylcysteine synthetase/decarboxylase
MSTERLDLKGRHIVLGMSGGVACYKAADLARELVKAGATVQVVMTEAAQQFMTPVTMQALSGRPVVTSQWDARARANMAHIDLSREADAIMVAPASADWIAQLAQGRAGELLSLLVSGAPHRALPLAAGAGDEPRDVVAPGDTAQRRSDHGRRRTGAGPRHKVRQACGETGDGRMLEPTELREELIAAFPTQSAGWALAAGDRRPHLRTFGSGTRHHQPFQRQDGFCDRASRCRRRALQVSLVAGPGAVWRRRVGCIVSMCRVRWTCTRRCCRLAPSRTMCSWPRQRWLIGVPVQAVQTHKIKKDGSGLVPQL